MLIIGLLLKIILGIIDRGSFSYSVTLTSQAVDVITASFIGITAVASSITIFISVRSSRITAFMELRKQYGSPMIGNAVRKLWEFYREDKETLVERYKKESIGFRRYREDCLHYQRRLVSQFYQQLENWWKSRPLNKKLLLSSWKAADLEIIPEIIIPIETEAIPIMTGTPEENIPTPKAPWLQNLENLYNRLNAVVE